jgi:hypothetical protein
LIAIIQVAIALSLASCWAPTVRVMDNTVGMAMGIPPIKRMKMSLRPQWQLYSKLA